MKNIFLETHRLYLQEFGLDDAEFIIELLNSDGWLKYIGDRNVKTIEEAEAYLLNGPMKSYEENGFGLAMVQIKDGRIPIGVCGLIKRNYLDHVDIGYALLPEYWGKGYDYEIADGTVLYAQEHLGIDEILGVTLKENARSISVLNKIGLNFDKHIWVESDNEEVMLFSNKAPVGKSY